MERTYTLHDLVAVLRRRRAVAIAVAAATLVVGVVMAVATPSEYSATSVVQLEPRRLPADFFPALAGGSYDERMRTVKHGILARPVLERVIRETDYDPEHRGDMDEAVSRLRRNVEVRLEGELAAGAPGLLFVVEVRGPDRERVARAAALLPRVYSELTRQVLAQQARALRETLDGQAAALAKVLSDEEAKQLAFKTQHLLELPEMSETNARSLARVQADIDGRLAAIADVRRRRTELLATIPEGPSAPGMAEAGLDATVRRLEALEAAYGATHPDVLRARREWEEARARRDGELQRFRRERVQTQLAALDETARESRDGLAALQKEKADLQRRIEAAPRWGQELAALSREYEVTRGRYAVAAGRRADAAAAEALLQADQPGLFRTVDEASVPSRPVAPDRPRLLWLALFAAVACGLGAAGAAEWLDASVRGPEDAGAMGVPVLATIPRIGPSRGRSA
jgi:uncharacterized protein involved in exopolysaccharide biosynthesis